MEIQTGKFAQEAFISLIVIFTNYYVFIYHYVSISQCVRNPCGHCEYPETIFMIIKTILTYVHFSPIYIQNVIVQ